MTKTTVVILADPDAGGEEALGRLFNALFLVYTLKDKGQPVGFVFQGAGARWGREVIKPEHPAHQLFKAVEDHLIGVCGGCADVFGAAEEVTAAGLALVRDRDIPGTTGVLDLSAYLGPEERLLVF